MSQRAQCSIPRSFVSFSPIKALFSLKREDLLCINTDAILPFFLEGRGVAKAVQLSELKTKPTIMKKYIATATLSFAIVFASFAQGDLKGPEYKNRKPWKDPKPATAVFTKQGESVKGAEAKNLRPLQRKDGQLAQLDLTTREKLTGPAYKNRKQ